MQAAIPVVQTMEIADDPIDINIGLSQRDAGYAATRHLVDLGHRRIGQISVPLDARARQRLDGYRAAMAEREPRTVDHLDRTAVELLRSAPSSSANSMPARRR